MNLRRLEIEDLGKCAELFAYVFKSEPWNEAWNFDHALKRLEHFYKSEGFFGVVCQDSSGEIKGFALGNREPFCSEELYYLREMCVCNSVQRTGIGSQILTFLEGLLGQEGVKAVYLATARGIPAADFYQKNYYKISDKMGFLSKGLLS